MTCCGSRERVSDGACGCQSGGCGCQSNGMDWGQQGFKTRLDDTFIIASESEFAGWKTGYGPECECGGACRGSSDNAVSGRPDRARLNGARALWAAAAIADIADLVRFEGDEEIDESDESDGDEDEENVTCSATDTECCVYIYCEEQALASTPLFKHCQIFTEDCDGVLTKIELTPHELIANAGRRMLEPDPERRAEMLSMIKMERGVPRPGGRPFVTYCEPCNFVGCGPKQEEGEEGEEETGLYCPIIDCINQAAIDYPLNCGDIKEIPRVDTGADFDDMPVDWGQILREQVDGDAYPAYKLGGPNCNTFVSHVATECGIPLPKVPVAYRLAMTGWGFDIKPYLASRAEWLYDLPLSR